VFALETLGCKLPKQIHSIGLPVINDLGYGTHDELMSQSGLSHEQILQSISDLTREI